MTAYCVILGPQVAPVKEVHLNGTVEKSASTHATTLLCTQQRTVDDVNLVGVRSESRAAAANSVTTK